MKALVCIILTLALLSLTLTAQAKQVDHWYIKHSGNNTPPVCDSTFSYFENYSVYYMDPRAEETPDEKVVYLTFDAGYENGNIEKTLDILKEENVPSAFFILQNMVYKSKHLLDRMVQEGHLICNHTAHHKNMAKATKDAFIKEIKEMEKIYSDATGLELTKFYRPPEGNFVEDNLAWAEELGYTTILWSYAYPDWDNLRQPDPILAKQKLFENIHDGAIILLHPTSDTNVEILREVICVLRQDGYRFASLSELK